MVGSWYQLLKWEFWFQGVGTCELFFLNSSLLANNVVDVKLLGCCCCFFNQTAVQCVTCDFYICKALIILPLQAKNEQKTNSIKKHCPNNRMMWEIGWLFQNLNTGLKRRCLHRCIVQLKVSSQQFSDIDLSGYNQDCVWSIEDDVYA